MAGVGNLNFSARGAAGEIRRRNAPHRKKKAKRKNTGEVTMRKTEETLSRSVLSQTIREPLSYRRELKNDGSKKTLVTGNFFDSASRTLELRTAEILKGGECQSGNGEGDKPRWWGLRKKGALQSTGGNHL